MSAGKALRTKTIARIEPSGSGMADDVVAVEEPLELRVGGRSLAAVMRTPGHDRELAAGFLVTEGIVRHRDEVLDMVRCGAAGDEGHENVLDVVLAPGVPMDWGRLTRHVFTSSSCGICSRATIDAVRTSFSRIDAPARVRVRRETLAQLPEALRAAQAGFAASGGLHASALFDVEGRLESVREDVGRHNALDKVIGEAFFAERLPLAGKVLLVSGRVSFELMQKALAAGISCVAAISAPTSAAVELAQATGQTLVGFLRGERMNVYAGTLAG